MTTFNTLGWIFACCVVIVLVLFSSLIFGLIGWGWNIENTWTCGLQGEAYNGDSCYQQSSDTDSSVWIYASDQLQKRVDKLCTSKGYIGGYITDESTSSPEQYICYQDTSYESGDISSNDSI